MSARYFCDICEEELQAGDHQRIKGKDGKLSFEIMTAIGGVWNAGHVCRRCIINAINQDTHDPARDLTLRAPETATLEATVKEIIDFVEPYFVKQRDFDEVSRFIRERLFR